MTRIILKSMVMAIFTFSVVISTAHDSGLEITNQKKVPSIITDMFGKGSFWPFSVTR